MTESRPRSYPHCSTRAILVSLVTAETPHATPHGAGLLIRQRNCLGNTQRRILPAWKIRLQHRHLSSSSLETLHSPARTDSHSDASPPIPHCYPPTSLFQTARCVESAAHSPPHVLLHILYALSPPAPPPKKPAVPKTPIDPRPVSGQVTGEFDVRTPLKVRPADRLRQAFRSTEPGSATLLDGAVPQFLQSPYTGRAAFRPDACHSRPFSQRWPQGIDRTRSPGEE